ncbi:hypothetical protein A9Q79_04525 [Methylophaga sp. 42_25_T18]|nr:hypothetical protein A9Q79_04525 [Methylophaga sp. 42_25_T18]OUR89790.1 hypothetical protein A9Q92_00610 [Methylophaga sp. 42_8_T64]
MKSSYLTNLVLVIVIVIVIASLFWFNQQASSPNDTYNKLSDISAGIITDITINRKQGEDIKLHKHTSGWKIVHPIVADGNHTRIRLLLSLLSAPIHNQLHDVDDTSLEKLGLKPIQVSLQLNEHMFAFGDVEPLSKRRYVLHNNNVYLIDDQVSPLLNTNVASFIDNRLLSATAQITKIQLPQLLNGQLAASTPLTIAKNDDRWSSSPQSYSADKLAALVASWQQASKSIQFDSQYRYTCLAMVKGSKYSN